MTLNSTGHCTNLPRLCSHAAQRTALPMIDDSARCPECGAALLRTAASPADSGSTSPAIRLAGIAVAALLVAGAAGWWLLGRSEPVAVPTRAAQSAPPPARAASAGTATLRLHGSNTVGAALAPALLRDFLGREGYDQVEQQPGAAAEESRFHARRSRDGNELDIELNAHGSATAFTDLRDAKADIGMSSRAIKQDEAGFTQSLGDLGAAGSEYVIALDGVAVIVHPANPVDRLTVEQLRGLYSGRIKDWAEVGGKPGPVHRLARDDKSGTFDTFKSLVLGKEPLAEGTQRLEDSAQLSDAVAADPQAIGFIGLPYVRQAKALAIADGDAAPLRPTRLTIATEDYPLARRLYLYVPTTAAPLARRFADYAISEDGQQIADKTGFVGQRPDPVEAGGPRGDVPADYRQLTDGAQRLSVNLRFRPGSMTLDNKAQQDLRRIVRLLEARQGDQRGHVMLLGFTDNLGGDTCANQRLSQERARAIATELGTYGLKITIAHGFGAAAPVATNTTEAGRERNRRVEVWLGNRNVSAPAGGCVATSARAQTRSPARAVAASEVALH